MTVNFSDMRDKLLTLDSVRESLASTEPITTFQVQPGSVKFYLNDWNDNPETAETMEDTDVTAAVVRVNNVEYPLTKEALLSATSAVGLSKAYVTRTPSDLVEPNLNYWMARGFKDLSLFASQGRAVALAPATRTPFSNLEILDNILQGVSDFGVDPEDVLVDYKYNHSLSRTNVRLVIPTRTRTLERTGVDNDEWSFGLQFQNSLVGSKQTRLEGYMFRWVCTNGMVSEHANSGVWSRRSNGQTDADVYQWAKESVDGILGGLESALDRVQGLVDIRVDEPGVAVDVLDDIYKLYKIRPGEQDSITGNMVEATNLTMYEIVNAVTAAANHPDLEPEHVDRLLRAGGDIAHDPSRCGACHQKVRH